MVLVIGIDIRIAQARGRGNNILRHVLARANVNTQVITVILIVIALLILCDKLAARHIKAVKRSIGSLFLLADKLMQGHHRRRTFENRLPCGADLFASLGGFS